MNIQPLNIYSNQTFTSSDRIVYKNLGGEFSNPYNTNNIKHRNTTYFYRQDTDWDMLRKFLINKYKNTDKVNTYCYACSDGSEPYTFIMDLKMNAPEQADKFLPIIAKDYDSYIINLAKSNTIYVADLEKMELCRKSKENFNRFFGKDDILDKRNNSLGRVYKINKELSDNVSFEVCNILDDIENIKPNNSIIFCKNFWHYLGSNQKINELAQKLYYRLGENSVVILGKYDFDKMVPCDAMLYAGFNLTNPSLRIFEKSPVMRIY